MLLAASTAAPPPCRPEAGRRPRGRSSPRTPRWSESGSTGIPNGSRLCRIAYQSTASPAGSKSPRAPPPITRCTRSSWRRRTRGAPTSSTRRCSGSGSAVKEGGGAEIPPPGVCPVCKARLPAGAVECRGCGLVLADADTELVEADEDDDDDFAVMSNLEVVQSFYTALKEGDESLVLGILHPEVEWVQNEGFPDGGSYVGAETVRNEVFLRLAEDWDGWQA